MLSVKIGNIFESNMFTLVNTVNCVGVMGKGIAKDFKLKYPLMFNQYKQACENHEIIPGMPYPYMENQQVKVLNFPTKQHWRSPSKLEYITKGLDWFISNYENLNIQSIAFPPLGCGNGGLSWDVVGPIMYKKLKDLPIDIEIYAPFNTSIQKISTEFLEKEVSENVKNTGKIYGKMNPHWLLALQIVKFLEHSQYSIKVGRLVFQKICYILTRYGVDMGLTFGKGTYGPYSKGINEMITILSNNNLIEEKQVGSLMLISTTSNFKINKNLYSKEEREATNKTYRLFKAIRNANEAEIITTIIYSCDELSQKYPSVTENMVYNSVHQWKTNYKNFQDEMYIRDFIKSLASAKLINVDYTRDFKEDIY